MTPDRKTAGEDISAAAVLDPTLPLDQAVTPGTATPVSGVLSAAPNKDITIGLAPASAADDSELVSTVVTLVNNAYADAEHGIFHAGYQRTSSAEISGFIRQGRLALAYLNASPANDSPVTGSRSGEASGQRHVIGCVHVKLLSPTLGDFAMLALDANHRGGGLARKLVLFAEDHCRKKGCTLMQLELLVPTSFEHAGKARMQAWYLRMGYRVVKLGSFQEEYPALAPLLAGPADYRIFEKEFV
ncbi:hypothetical protein TOPH_02116 [Tolypocladium ophioglossoides CBS 100239]|uniref:N-acetyltransferase domain-containing protein n=1 Tax=Tolypocladium ophioglossoides (strain CBS 100239) TaxID=1163406 RepID=A0A0L0NGE5_TOLOC|nr:hypothetical protein TOPH_02116 [Tolypocladium ophioglossoides CBS 100239]